MLKAVIIDDETDAIQSLRILLEEFCTDIEVCDTATTLLDGIKVINAAQPEIVFLDIELTTGSGFEILSCFPDRNFEVVFVTAYESYALKAIKHEALDYLLKPIDIDDLLATIQKLVPEKNISAREKTKTLNAPKAKHHKIPVYTNDGIIYIAIKSIIHIKAEGSYSVIYIKNDRPLVVSKNLKEFEKLLEDYRFFRVHNSHLINLDYVEKYVKADGGKIIMADKSEIEVSRNKKDQFLSIMNNAGM